MPGQRFTFQLFLTGENRELAGILKFAGVGDALPAHLLRILGAVEQTQGVLATSSVLAADARHSRFDAQSKSAIRNALIRGHSEVTVDSYFISEDGRFAALQGRVSVPIKDGKPVMVPAAIIFEFEDGQIVKGDI